MEPTLINQMIATLNTSNESLLNADQHTYTALFISCVNPDVTNARFFPATIIEDHHAEQFAQHKLSRQQLINIYQAEQTILIGKSCMINLLDSQSIERKKAQKSIDSILELSENIKVSELIQAPTVYPISESRYQILTGHRRFFAMIYAFGVNVAAQFKVYEQPPLLKKTKQFQENSSREDLPQYGKLAAFLSAKDEIETLSLANKQIGLKAITVSEMASMLGISMGAYDNYNVLTRYPSVLQAYENGMAHPFIKIKKQVLSIEQEYKTAHNKKVLNATDKKTINLMIKDILSGVNITTKTPQAVHHGNFGFDHIITGQTVKKLLTINVLNEIKNINWKSINWDDNHQVTEAVKKVITHLQK
ncbi:ParB N-terminal domain-containing protein [Flocculibacter collagenilyticus]|uniref:ParB N-terminal domain-containing protein n=1 Tax=Flocculibacter collagenilyticus TaxID=2744479 RepID=UPI0018F725F0|nr:ParB N-terminal domain-containing protein [Flocculibacter collagenilyticus]